MSSSVRTMLFNPRPLRSLVATSRARRAYATIPTKNPTPSPPKEDSNEQAMPIGRFYEAILNSGQPIPAVKPEEPASSVKAAQEEDSPKEPAKRGRKPKVKAEPAATATAGSSPTASPAASIKETAKQVAAKTSSPPSIGTSPPTPMPPPTQSSAEDKAKVIFGSSLAGPAERAEQLARLREKSTLIAGVLVPPKPEEPDNCCMSGCVNCVWDRYRDEMEDWALADAEAKRKLAAARGAGASVGDDAKSVKRSPTTTSGTDHTAVSMDDDGGGSDTNWDVSSTTPSPKIAKDFWDDDLYKNVPVGIREFMKQEKRLKEKHAREGTSGG
ncbi:hypothetical protein KVR01_000071 [Diaporthe batatas]|uniref:uncharacterized protein n=1 Tax=Diaporthe batatas TaxID=748121 RepID=UPI001D05BC24|nr:uncharacterized protein KVR01_000071 [Diaporthe batatas]KAG8169326.1 hypothetical protein KVR01_000071 [Diaporthe batatas]